jgi:bifunctional non-homologous end joining protein LigD
MNKILSNLDKSEREKLHKSEQPGYISPMLAKLTHNHFSDKNWIFERKLDGERCLIYKKDHKISIYSRNKKKLNKTYPEVVDALSRQNSGNFIIDGEIVTFVKNRTSFSKLQHRMQLKDMQDIENSNVKIYYYIFDVIYYDGYILSDIGLRVRKKVLKAMFDYRDPLRYTAHRNKEGGSYFKEACQKGWEGLIAKKADSKYIHKRSSDWLKFKCGNQQEFVIVGFTDPEGDRIGFGALLLGFYKDGKLQFAGKVGTGFDDEELKNLHEKLRLIEQDKAEVKNNVSLPSKHVHWVKPQYVAEIGFTEWTNINKLRHPRYLGLRRDKDAKKVVREE